MPKHQINLFFYPSLLKLAGFVLIVVFGLFSSLAVALGSILFVLGISLSQKIEDSGKLEKVGVISIVLLLINFVFFSTREISPFVDTSLAIYLLILLDLFLLVKRSLALRKEKARLPSFWPFAIFLLSIVLSAIFAISAKEVIYYGAIYTFAFVLFLLVLNLFTKKVSILNILWTTVVLGVISAIFATWQLYSQSFKVFFYPFIVTRDQEILELWEVVSRVVGTWQHPSYLGIMLALCIPLGLYLLFFETKSLSIKILLALSLAFISAVLLLTNTRSSAISAVVGVIFLFIYSKPARGRLLPTVKQFAVIGLIAGLAMLLYQFVFVSEIYTKPQAWRVDASATIWGRFLRSDRMSTESLVQRSQLYSLAWDEFRTHPIVGIGAKNFPHVVEGIFERGTDAHNIFLQTMAETGIIGFLALLALYGKLFYLLLKNRSDGVDFKLKAPLLAVLTVIFFDSLFNNPLYSLRILAIFWLAAALIYVNNITNAQIGNKPARLEP